MHLIGGVADGMVPADVDGLLRAAEEAGVLGTSLYDWRTTSPALLPLRG